jgi:hypothetical protein
MYFTRITFALQWRIAIMFSTTGYMRWLLLDAVKGPTFIALGG